MKSLIKGAGEVAIHYAQAIAGLALVVVPLFLFMALMDFISKGGGQL